MAPFSSNMITHQFTSMVFKDMNEWRLQARPFCPTIVQMLSWKNSSLDIPINTLLNLIDIFVKGDKAVVAAKGGLTPCESLCLNKNGMSLRSMCVQRQVNQFFC
ncbi:hypothetical protein AMECASPLE_039467 [Ameca splendens]|uniref:Uncharacterized protein n=1 Tax=Ameca splendens TaxID=208324 RepID=A0ABV0Z6B2_9TELE